MHPASILHAPSVNVTLYGLSTAPWFDTECHLAKVRTRKLEKLYRSQRTPQTEKEWREQFLCQRRLYQTKFTSYWKTAIESCSNSKSLWSKLRCLLHPSNSAVFQYCLLYTSPSPRDGLLSRMP